MRQILTIEVYGMLAKSQIILNKLGLHSSILYYQVCFSITEDCKWDSMMIRQAIQATRPRLYQEHVQRFIGRIGLVPPFPGTKYR